MSARRTLSGLLVVCQLSAILQPTQTALAADSALTLEEKTRRAEARVTAWEQEDQRLEKRSNWEIPLVVALFVAGGALASKNKTYAYSGAFVAGTGLGLHFLWGHDATAVSGSLSSGQ